MAFEDTCIILDFAMIQHMIVVGLPKGSHQGVQMKLDSQHLSYKQKTPMLPWLGMLLFLIWTIILTLMMGQCQIKTFVDLF